MYAYFSHVTGITHRSLNISEDTGFHTKIIIFITTNSHTNFLTSFKAKHDLLTSHLMQVMHTFHSNYKRGRDHLHRTCLGIPLCCFAYVFYVNH